MVKIDNPTPQPDRHGDEANPKLMYNNSVARPKRKNVAAEKKSGTGLSRVGAKAVG